MSDLNTNIVVIGGGQAASQVCISLRAMGHRGRITLVSEEPLLPYCRPPLSKQYLVADRTPDWLLYRPTAFYAKQAIDVRLGCRAESIDRGRQEVLLGNGERLPYDGLALALGSRVRRMSVPGADANHVCYIRNLADVSTLRQRLLSARRVVIVGGGFIGLEVAAVLLKTGRDVTLLASGASVLPRAGVGIVGAFVQAYHQAQGVRVLTNSEVVHLRPRADDGADVHCADGSVHAADLVIAGIGIVPNTELAQTAGLDCDDGIQVDEYCRSSDARIVAAGDCTRHPNALAGRTVRLETVHNAVEQAKTAAATLACRAQPYRQAPWVWSDQYNLRLQSVGLWQDHDEWVLRGRVDDGQFSVYYFRAGQFIAMEGVNRPAEFGTSRRLLNEGIGLTPAQAADQRFDLQRLLPSKRRLVFEQPWPALRLTSSDRLGFVPP